MKINTITRARPHFFRYLRTSTSPVLIVVGAAGLVLAFRFKLWRLTALALPVLGRMALSAAQALYRAHQEAHCEADLAEGNFWARWDLGESYRGPAEHHRDSGDASHTEAMPSVQTVAIGPAGIQLDDWILPFGDVITRLTRMNRESGPSSRIELYLERQTLTGLVRHRIRIPVMPGCERELDLLEGSMAASFQDSERRIRLREIQIIAGGVALMVALVMMRLR